jgi:PAS domain-containing protein
MYLLGGTRVSNKPYTRVPVTRAGGGQEIDTYDDDTGVFEVPTPQSASLDRSKMIAGRYEIIERIGAGSMGQVLHVRHMRLGKSFALKLMQAEYSLDPAAIDLFRSEAQLASTLCHPNIVSVVDFGEDPDWGLFIAMEYVQGEALSDRIALQRALPIEAACHVAIRIASALQHSHEHHIVHADVKSENVVCVEEDGGSEWQVKLLDFGTARLASRSSAKEDQISGTPEYMAPERIMGNPPAPSNDIYALGVLLYEMLTGSVPFVGSEPTELLKHHLNDVPQSVGARRGEVLDDVLDGIVSKALEKDPAMRYARAEDVAEALRDYLSEKDARQREMDQRTGLVEHTREEAAADAFDALNIAAAGVDANGTIRVANRAFAKLLRVATSEELEGRSILETPLAQLHRGIREDLRLVAMKNNLIRRRLEVRLKSGKQLAIRLSMSPAHGRAGSCMLVLHALRRR